jgi:polygalacturonase
MINQKVLFFLTILALFFPPGCQKHVKTMWPGEKAESILSQIKVPVFQDKIYNIKDFGAIGDSTFLNTEFINKTIYECSSSGGGTVIIPSGIFLTGAIHLQDNVNLRLEKGSELRFSTHPSDFLPLVKTSWEGILCYNYSPLVYAENKKNIAITGEGLLNGMASNQDWWRWKGFSQFGWEENTDSQQNSDARPLLDKYNSDRTPVTERIMGDGHFLRPQFIQFFQCENILVENISITNSPFWVIHPVYCINLTVRDVKINSLGPNNDGCDPESSKNVLIEGCVFNTGDDCIALKSGRNEDGRETGISTENIVIRNCKMKNGHGGVVVGSEISGGVKNVLIEDCEMDSPELDRAIRFKTNNNRGGVTDSIYIRNIKIGEVREAVVRMTCMYDPSEGQGSFQPVIRNVFISGVTCEKANYALFLEGINNFNSIENIYIENSSFSGVKKPNISKNVKNLILKNVKINGEIYSEN